MGILDEVREAQANAVPLRCKVAIALDSLSKGERSELEEVLAEPSWMHVSIAKVLQGRGIEVKADAVSNHRRGMCGCARR